jgi:hypothetical protein
MLTEEQWDQVQDLFDRGLNATAHAREDLLVDVESELANAVRELWRQHNEAGSFLNEPLISADRRFAFQDGESVANRFTILKSIGSGGMGEVYQALDN